MATSRAAKWKTATNKPRNKQKEKQMMENSVDLNSGGERMRDEYLQSELQKDTT